MKLHHTRLIVPLVALVAAGITATAALAAAPSNTVPPTTTGTPEKGMTLTAHNGSWTGNPASYLYRWQRCAADGTACANIVGASGKTYTLTSTDIDNTIRFRVTAVNADGRTAAFSKPTTLVSDSQAPNDTARPTITGTPQPGEELNTSNGTWTGGVTSFTYQWQRCDPSGSACADVAGATGKAYGHVACAGARARRRQPQADDPDPVRPLGRCPDLRPVPHLRRLAPEREHSPA